MARQFQAPTQIKQGPTKEEALLNPIAQTLQTLPSQWAQYKRQRLLEDLELKKARSQYGTGEPAPTFETAPASSLQPGQLLSAPPADAGPEEQMLGFEATMPTVKPETFEEKRGRVGDAGIESESKFIDSQIKMQKLSGKNGKDENTFTQENQLRSQYISKVKDFSLVRDSYNRIEEAAREPSAAGDLALIFNYMKMLDPGSTVREGEFANAQNSAGVPERVKAAYNNAISGERLAPATRGDFIKQAKGQYNAAFTGYKKDASEFRRIAERSGLDPDLVVLDMVTPQSVTGGSTKEAPIGTPKAGAVEDGYRFIGGNPADPTSWEKL